MIAGRFYWATPAWDYDCEGKYIDSWINNPQPARYEGNDIWTWLGTDNEDWPARWVGSEIESPV